MPVRNPGAQDGAWKMRKYNARHTVYAKKTLPLAKQLEAASKLAAVEMDGKEKAAADLFEKVL